MGLSMGTVGTSHYDVKGEMQMHDTGAELHVVCAGQRVIQEG